MSVLSEAPTDRMLDPAGVADVLGVSREYVYRLMNQGTMPSKKIGGVRRIWMSELRDWIAAH